MSIESTPVRRADRASIVPGFAGRTALSLCVLVVAASCDRGPDAQALAELQAKCDRAVADWLQKQGSLGADYAAEPHYDHGGQRCLAHVRGGATAETQFETVVDVQHDRILAGCSAVREAVGDTACQVNGEPVSRAAGRKTIDRLTGQR